MKKLLMLLLIILLSACAVTPDPEEPEVSEPRQELVTTKKVDFKFESDNFDSIALEGQKFYVALVDYAETFTMFRTKSLGYYDFEDNQYHELLSFDKESSRNWGYVVYEDNIFYIDFLQDAIDDYGFPYRMVYHDASGDNVVLEGVAPGIDFIPDLAKDQANVYFIHTTVESDYSSCLMQYDLKHKELKTLKCYGTYTTDNTPKTEYLLMAKLNLTNAGISYGSYPGSQQSETIINTWSLPGMEHEAHRIESYFAPYAMAFENHFLIEYYENNTSKDVLISREDRSELSVKNYFGRMGSLGNRAYFVGDDFRVYTYDDSRNESHIESAPYTSSEGTPFVYAMENGAIVVQSKDNGEASFYIMEWKERK